MGKESKENKDNGKNKKNGNGGDKKDEKQSRLHPDTKKSIWGIVFVGAAIISVLAWVGYAGPAGDATYRGFTKLFGVGYFILPLTLLFVAGALLFDHGKRFMGITIAGAALFILSALGILDIASSGSGGWLGLVLGSLKYPFNTAGGFVIDLIVLLISFLIVFNVPIRFGWPDWSFKRGNEGKPKQKEMTVQSAAGEEDENLEEVEEEPEPEENKEEPKQVKEPMIVAHQEPVIAKKGSLMISRKLTNYVAPPLELLKTSVEKPTTGDLRANANIIKRTLESFGVAVEMGEIHIGPKFTRYTLKPAEGMKLSKIVALGSDLALALAAHPIRIEAPIPGKSLVGVEVPNKAAAIVRLGNLLGYPEFQAKGPLAFVIGRDVNGEPIFADIEKMPHMLVAGATGSGKSVLVHSAIIALLYKNSPSNLKMVMIDPKRVELSMYDGLPHLALPVITDNKKAIGVFRWAVSEMEKRYDLLGTERCQNIKSYNEKHPNEPIPFILVVVDEMADLMMSYGKEVEGLIIRLAQMARATGIHLLLATQRPSVEVITGLIKANLPHRFALKVMDIVNSRTILDASGAEKLLGGGDLLYQSPENSKPKRIQGSYVSEEEINNVVDFIREHNRPEGTPEILIESGNGQGSGIGVGTPAGEMPNEVLDDYLEDENDALYDEAVEVVATAKKASASLLQRRLKVGYARAARLLDLMEANGVIGPGDGAKPREVFFDKLPDQTQ